MFWTYKKLHIKPIRLLSAGNLRLISARTTIHANMQ